MCRENLRIPTIPASSGIICTKIEGIGVLPVPVLLLGLVLTSRTRRKRVNVFIRRKISFIPLQNRRKSEEIHQDHETDAEKREAKRAKTHQNKSRKR